MNRRQFLQYLPGLGYLILESPQLLGQTLSRYLHSDQVKELTIYPSDGSYSRQIPIHWVHKLAYANISHVASILNYHTYFNHEKKKLVVYLPQNKMVVCGNNPFLIIDNRPLQMPISALWHQKGIYVPLKYWVKVVNEYTNLSMDYQLDKQVLRFFSNSYNVSGITIDNRENGMVIRIQTSRRYKRREMTADFRYNWLHIDLYGAKGDTKLLGNTRPKGHIKEIQLYPFEQLLSIGFRLRKIPISTEIYQDTNTNEVVTILRYKRQISKKQRQRSKSKKRSASDRVEKQLEAEKKRWLIDTIVIDAGHGGKDPGAIGAGHLKEKEIVLGIALKLGKLIEKKLPGVKVIYTRKKDTFVELRRRTQIANENNAKIFISIHANATRNFSATGFETYILGSERGEQARAVVERENSVIQFEDPSTQNSYKGINTILATMAQSAFLKHSEQLAYQVQLEMDKHLKNSNMKNRGVKQAPFWVMVGASMPCILVETGFITNKNDARILKSKHYQQKIAEGIFTGLKQFKRDYESTI